MNSKIKILLIGLAVLCGASLIIAFQLNAVNKSLRSEFAYKQSEFEQKEISLNKQLSATLESKKKLDLEMADLRAKLGELTKDRDSFKGKFDMVTEERSKLYDRVQGLAGEKKALEEEVVKLKKAGGVISYAMPDAGGKDDAYWASVLKEKAGLEIEVKNLRTQLDNLQLKSEKAMEEGRKLDLQLKTITEARTDLIRRVAYNEKLAETLSEDLVREKRDKKAIADQHENLRQENFELKSRLMALGDKKTSLESRVVDLQQERELLSKRLAELDQVLQERVDQIIQVKDDIRAVRTEAKDLTAKDSKVVQLQPIVVRASQESMPTGRAPKAGQVLAINDENNFVIIDVGEQDGIRVGQTFTVIRNNQKIANVEVIQTRKEISAADIKNLSAGSRIKIGDMVN